MKRYYIMDSTKEFGFFEVTEEVFRSLVGDEITGPYAQKVYRGELSIEDVPENLREDVQAVVDANVAYLGEYQKQEIPEGELSDLLKEVL